MSFTEWLNRYLIGEDMTGTVSSAFHPGPVKLQHLPVSASERPEPVRPGPRHVRRWHPLAGAGPSRGDL